MQRMHGRPETAEEEMGRDNGGLLKRGAIRLVSPLSSWAEKRRIRCPDVELVGRWAQAILLLREFSHAVTAADYVTSGMSVSTFFFTCKNTINKIF